MSDTTTPAQEPENQAVADTIATVLMGIRDHIPSLMGELGYAKAGLPPGYDIELVLLVQTPLTDEPLEIHVRERILEHANEADQHQNEAPAS